MALRVPSKGPGLLVGRRAIEHLGLGSSAEPPPPSARSRRVVRHELVGEFYEHPAANWFRKHWKSLAVRMGEIDEPSQFAYGNEEAKAFRKH